MVGITLAADAIKANIARADVAMFNGLNDGVHADGNLVVFGMSEDYKQSATRPVFLKLSKVKRHTSHRPIRRYPADTSLLIQALRGLKPMEQAPGEHAPWTRVSLLV